jgi:hypothetical protein
VSAEAELLTLEEAARRLGFKSGRSVRRLAADGAFPLLYPRPRSPRVAAPDLAAYVDALAQARHIPSGMGRAVRPLTEDSTCQDRADNADAIETGSSPPPASTRISPRTTCGWPSTCSTPPKRGGQFSRCFHVRTVAPIGRHATPLCRWLYRRGTVSGQDLFIQRAAHPRPRGVRRPVGRQAPVHRGRDVSLVNRCVRAAVHGSSAPVLCLLTAYISHP